MKRLLDIALAVFGLIVAFPVMVVIAILLKIFGLIVAFPVMVVIAVLLKIDSSGDTFFSQKRLGKNGEIFKIHKFGVTTQNDVRMTSFGAFLERTKLDELPQLWNILKGEMSFVGPRPESLRYEGLFAGEYEKLLDYTPGIFGPNQVAFRNESAMYPVDEDPEEFYKRELFPQKAKNDLAYFKEATILSDIKWMFKSTLGTLLGVFNWQRVKKRYGLILAFDFILFQIAWCIAHVFRFDGFNLSKSNSEVFLTGCWLIPLVIFPIMLIGGVYRHPFRYFSVKDVFRLSTVTFSACILAIFIQFGFFQRNFSIGIGLLTVLLFLVLLLIPRVIRREKWLKEHPETSVLDRKILIVGVNKKSTALLSFFEKSYSNIKVVGYLDEDQDLRGRYVLGSKVLGSWRDVSSVYDRYKFEELWISEFNPLFSKNDVLEFSRVSGCKTFFLEDFLGAK